MSRARDLMFKLSEAKDPIYITQTQVLAMLKGTFPEITKLRTDGITGIWGTFPDGESLNIGIQFGRKGRDTRFFRLTKGILGDSKSLNFETDSLKGLSKEIQKLV